MKQLFVVALMITAIATAAADNQMQEQKPAAEIQLVEPKKHTFNNSTINEILNEALDIKDSLLKAKLLYWVAHNHESALAKQKTYKDLLNHIQSVFPEFKEVPGYHGQLLYRVITDKVIINEVTKIDRVSLSSFAEKFAYFLSGKWMLTAIVEIKSNKCMPDGTPCFTAALTDRNSNNPALRSLNLNDLEYELPERNNAGLDGKNRCIFDDYEETFLRAYKVEKDKQVKTLSFQQYEKPFQNQAANASDNNQQQVKVTPATEQQ